MANALYNAPQVEDNKEGTCTCSFDKL